MKIHLYNEIQIDGQMEVIQQTFPVEVVQKPDALYLLYTNDEKEKVVLKCGATELTMTRFSTPKSIMRFIAGDQAIVTLPTPMGIQHFVTDTQAYALDPAGQCLDLQYDLKPLDSQAIFASYQMGIQWG